MLYANSHISMAASVLFSDIYTTDIVSLQGKKKKGKAEKRLA